MKTFTIEFPNKKIDATGVYKNYLLNRLNDAYPELTLDGIDGEKTNNSYQYIGPKARVGFGTSPLFNVSRYTGNYSTLKYPYYSEPKSYNLATDFQKAMKKLNDYAEYMRMCNNLPDDYDFKYFGIPVKEHQNFIQIGNTIVPKRKGNYYFDDLSSKQRTIVINVIVNINKVTNIYS